MEKINQLRAENKWLLSRLGNASKLQRKLIINQIVQNLLEIDKLFGEMDWRERREMIIDKHLKCEIERKSFIESLGS